MSGFYPMLVKLFFITCKGFNIISCEDWGSNSPTYCDLKIYCTGLWKEKESKEILLIKNGHWTTVLQTGTPGVFL